MDLPERVMASRRRQRIAPQPAVASILASARASRLARWRGGSLYGSLRLSPSNGSSTPCLSPRYGGEREVQLAAKRFVGGRMGCVARFAVWGRFHGGVLTRPARGGDLPDVPQAGLGEVWRRRLTETISLAYGPRSGGLVRRSLVGWTWNVPNSVPGSGGGGIPAVAHPRPACGAGRGRVLSSAAVHGPLRTKTAGLEVRVRVRCAVWCNAVSCTGGLCRAQGPPQGQGISAIQAAACWATLRPTS